MSFKMADHQNILPIYDQQLESRLDMTLRTHTKDEVEYLRVMNQIRNQTSHWYFYLRSKDHQMALCMVDECLKSISCRGGSTKSMRGHLLRIHSIDLDLLKNPKGLFDCF